MGFAHDYEDMTCMFWDAHGGVLLILVVFDFSFLFV